MLLYLGKAQDYGVTLLPNAWSIHAEVASSSVEAEKPPHPLPPAFPRVLEQQGAGNVLLGGARALEVGLEKAEEACAWEGPVVL